MDVPGQVMALHVAPVDVDDRVEVGRLSAEVWAKTRDSVELAFVDQGYSGPKPASAGSAHGIATEVVRAPSAKRGFVRLSRRCVVERSFVWAIHCRRLIEDHERNASPLPGLHLFAFVCLMLRQAEKPLIDA